MDKKLSNRINAQKSTGPQTTAGKAISSKNAQLHGLLSKDLVISGENRADFDSLLNQLIDELEPNGLIEFSLVEKLAISLWRQKRLVRAESARISLAARQDTTSTKLEIRAALGNSNDLIFDGLDDYLDSKVTLDAGQLGNHLKVWRKLASYKLPNKSVADLPDAYKSILDDLAQSTGKSPDELISRYGGWSEFCKIQIEHAQSSLRALEVQTIANQVLIAKSIPENPDLLSRYQSALDNEFNKTLRALREAQNWRRERAILNATPVNADD